jgi:hypothetical protein
MMSPRHHKRSNIPSSYDLYERAADAPYEEERAPLPPSGRRYPSVRVLENGTKKYRKAVRRLKGRIDRGTVVFLPLALDDEEFL